MRILVTSAVATANALVTLMRSRSTAQRPRVGVGDVAPDFSLEGSDGRVHRLVEYRGRPVVLAWFPKAFTGGCAVQCQSLGAHAPRVRDSGVVLLGANLDRPETNRAFAADLGVDFPILSDPEGAIARAYGVLRASGLPERCTFYIDGTGRVQAVDTQVRVSTHGDDVERQLKQLRAASDGSTDPART